MAAAKSRSRRHLELGLSLGPPDYSKTSPALVGQSPETPMREANPHHILSIQGLLSGTEGGTGSRNITAPPTASGETAYQLPTKSGPLGGISGTGADTGLFNKVDTVEASRVASGVSKVADAASSALQYTPENLIKKYVIKKPLAAAAKSVLGKKAVADASKTGIAKILSLFL